MNNSKLYRVLRIVALIQAIIIMTGIIIAGIFLIFAGARLANTLDNIDNDSPVVTEEYVPEYDGTELPDSFDPEEEDYTTTCDPRNPMYQAEMCE
jgi:hypothetical protein